MEMEKKEAQEAEKKALDEFAVFKADINKKYAGLTDVAKKIVFGPVGCLSPPSSSYSSSYPSFGRPTALTYQ